MENLYSEIQSKGKNVIFWGDFNAHEKEWLQNSKLKSNKLGRYLRDFSESNGLGQIVKKPTRGDNTLDLVISPFEGNVEYYEGCGTSDHQTLIAKMQLVLETVEISPYHWKQADWGQMKKEMKKIQIDFTNMSSDEAADITTKKIKEIIDKYVPSKIPKMRRPLPWWNLQCERAWLKKKEAFDSGDRKIFAVRKKKANKIFKKAFYSHIIRLKIKMKRGSSSKVWWKMTKNLAGLNSVRRKATPAVQDIAEYFSPKMSIPYMRKKKISLK